MPPMSPLSNLSVTMPDLACLATTGGGPIGCSHIPSQQGGEQQYDGAHHAVSSMNTAFQAWSVQHTDDQRRACEHEQAMEQHRLKSQLELKRMEMQHGAEERAHEHKEQQLQRKHTLKMQKLVLQTAPAMASAAAPPPAPALAAIPAAATVLDHVRDFNTTLFLVTTKLQGSEDFDSWSYLLKELAVINGLLGYLTGAKARPLAMDAAALACWMCEAGAMKSAIVSNVDPV
ncbi:hypothetical protein BDV93DRAFT_563217 [Ceratobasidium sp. AG-I]|nr:hypothetical protein BDV93DRAFT_563217 [Ceratobasidium sp. AG-I]